MTNNSDSIQLMEKNNPKITNAWCSYDGANSVYNLIIATAIFPGFYEEVTKGLLGEGMVNFLGFTIKNTVLYSYAISFSFLVIVFLSPLLSGIADYSGKKKMFMRFFTYMGGLSCIGLYWFEGMNIEYGIACAVIASIGYAGSLVFYNAFLPEIATEDQMDRISARGFSMGYFISVLILVICLAMVLYPEIFGIKNENHAMQISFLIVGIWWISFSQIAFFNLKDKPTNHKINAKVLTKGFKELKKVFINLKQHVTTSRFLGAFFVYSMGVQTLIYLASLFAKTELEMVIDQLIKVIIIIQVVAILGAMLFAFISKKKGNKASIAIALIIWAFISICGFFLTEHLHFYMLAALLGLVMGGIQSISRSTYSKLIPEDTEDTASYFSFYDVTEKLSIVIGTFSYGMIENLFSMRVSILSMTLFFLVGLGILMTAKFKFKNEGA